MGANVRYDEDVVQKVKFTISAAELLGNNDTIGGKAPTGPTTTIPFQYPPIVKSDSKSGSWLETPQRFAEPIAIYKGGNPREIDLVWTYIVTGQTQSGALWSVAWIAQWVKTLRGYFYNTAGHNLIIKFAAYDVVGIWGDFWTFRADSVNITHSDTLITDTTGTYPLRTDISMKLKFLTNLAATGSGSVPSNDQEKVFIPGAKRLPDKLAWL